MLTESSFQFRGSWLPTECGIMLYRVLDWLIPPQTIRYGTGITVFTGNGVFSYCCSCTFTRIKDLSTSSTTARGGSYMLSCFTFVFFLILQTPDQTQTLRYFQHGYDGFFLFCIHLNINSKCQVWVSVLQNQRLMVSFIIFAPTFNNYTVRDTSEERQR